MVTSCFSRAVKVWRDRLSKNSLIKDLLHYISYCYIRYMKALYATDMKIGTNDSLES